MESGVLETGPSSQNDLRILLREDEGQLGLPIGIEGEALRRAGARAAVKAMGSRSVFGFGI